MGNCFAPPSPGVSTSDNGNSSSTTISKVSRGSISRQIGFSMDDATSYPEGRILEAPNLRTFTLAEMRSATRNFKPDTLLGEGGFGKVYRGWVDEKTLNPAKSTSGMMVAIKKLSPESTQGLEEWQSEINFLGRLWHPNLVKLLGYCVEGRELLLVYEHMAKGSLENHLFRRGSNYQPISWDVRMKIAIGAARGLAFLHTSEKQIIYRDFKAANILLDSNFNPKLSDFGLAKDGPAAGNSHVTTRILGTYGYAAPEYVATGHLYVKSDVYGFGVVLLEILSGMRALDTNRPSGQHNLVDFARPFLSDRLKLSRLMDPRLEGQYPSKAALQAAQLTVRCISVDPRARPSMKDVLCTLEQIESMKNRLPDTKPRSPKLACSNQSLTSGNHQAFHSKHENAVHGGPSSYHSPRVRK